MTIYRLDHDTLTKLPQDEDRFFSKDEEVFFVGGNSYLLMNQWSKVLTERALTEIISILPEGHGISYQALGGADLRDHRG